MDLGTGPAEKGKHFAARWAPSRAARHVVVPETVLMKPPLESNQSKSILK